MRDDCKVLFPSCLFIFRLFPFSLLFRWSRFVYSHILISSTGGTYTPTQPTEDRIGGINLYILYGTQSNKCRPRSDLRKLVWFYSVCVPISLIIFPHLFCIESIAIQHINKCNFRTDLRMYQYSY